MHVSLPYYVGFEYNVELVPSIVVQDEFNSDVNNNIGIYEDDLIDKWTRSWDFGSANGLYVHLLILLHRH